MIIPPFLRSGDTVGVVAPASRFPYDEVVEGLRILREDWQLNVIEGESLRATEGAFAGSDDLRRTDLQTLFDNPAVRAVFAARGGYGCYRIVDDLNLTEFLKKPKWLIGFSDVTVLLSMLVNQGVMSLHGLMPRQFGDPDRADALASVRQWLFGNPPAQYTVPAHPLNRTGRAEGQLIGGNLTLLINSIGTQTDLDFAGKILFIEDIDETLFSLDRMLSQLRRAGRLANLSGLIVGQFTDIRDNRNTPFGKTAYEIINRAVSDYNYPVLFDFPAGHVPYNLTLPIGLPVTLDVQSAVAQLDFSAVHSESVR